MFADNGTLNDWTPVGPTLDRQIAFLSHVQPNPMHNHAYNMISLLLFLDPYCWLVTILSGLLIQRFVAFSRKLRPFTGRALVSWIDMTSYGLGQGAHQCCAHFTTDYKLAVGGWLLWMKILTGVMGSMVYAIIVHQPIFQVDTLEDLLVAIRIYGFKVFRIDTKILNIMFEVGEMQSLL